MVGWVIPFYLLSSLLPLTLAQVPPGGEQQPQPPADWTSNYDDHTLLSNIYILGSQASLSVASNLVLIESSEDETSTIDSATALIIGACQTLSIAEQLAIGIRYLDIQLNSNTLHIIHNSSSLHTNPSVWFVYDTGYTFGMLHSELITFLTNNPKEYIVLHIKANKNENVATPLWKIISHFSTAEKNFYYLGNTIPSLQQARGKIIILNDYDVIIPGIPVQVGGQPGQQQQPGGGGGGHGGQGQGAVAVVDQQQTYFIPYESTHILIQDNDIITAQSTDCSYGIGNKWDDIETFFESTQPTSDYWLINYAHAIGDGVNGMTNCYPAVTAKDINNKLAHYFASSPWATAYQGIVVMDFVDKGLLSSLVEPIMVVQAPVSEAISYQLASYLILVILFTTVICGILPYLSTLYLFNILIHHASPCVLIYLYFEKDFPTYLLISLSVWLFTHCAFIIISLCTVESETHRSLLISLVGVESFEGDAKRKFLFFSGLILTILCELIAMVTYIFVEYLEAPITLVTISGIGLLISSLHAWSLGLRLYRSAREGSMLSVKTPLITNSPDKAINYQTNLTSEMDGEDPEVDNWNEEQEKQNSGVTIGGW